MTDQGRQLDGVVEALARLEERLSNRLTTHVLVRSCDGATCASMEFFGWLRRYIVEDAEYECSIVVESGCFGTLEYTINATRSRVEDLPDADASGFVLHHGEVVITFTY